MFQKMLQGGSGGDSKNGSIPAGIASCTNIAETAYNMFDNNPNTRCYIPAGSSAPHYAQYSYSKPIYLSEFSMLISDADRISTIKLHASTDNFTSVDDVIAIINNPSNSFKQPVSVTQGYTDFRIELIKNDTGTNIYMIDFYGHVDE